MRDYQLMKQLLCIVAHKAPCKSGAFYGLREDNATVYKELARLQFEGLVNGSLEFDDSDVFLGGSIEGITDEGKEFLRLIENQDVWALVLQTLRKADIDISYPLLKEVCEEIIKRYVTSCIPKI